MKIKVIILFLLCAFVKHGNSQIIVGDSISAGVEYHRIDSTVLLPWHACSFVDKTVDITTDGIGDLKFVHGNCASPSFNQEEHYVYILNNSIQLAVCQNNILWPDTVVIGSIIDCSRIWKDSTARFTLKHFTYSYQYSSSSGVFSGNSKFIGFRVLGVNDTTYGWINIGVNGANGLRGIVIRSYAFGNSTIGIKNNNPVDADLIIYPNPANDKIHIEQISLYGKIRKVILINSFGLRYEQSLNDENEIEISQLPNGIYVLSIKTDLSIATKKIVVQH